MASLELINPWLYHSSREWYVQATSRGISHELALNQSKSIPKLVIGWLSSLSEQTDQSSHYYKRNGSSLPFSVELLYNNTLLTVITHLKMIIGSGHQSTVKASLIYLSIDLLTGRQVRPAGTLVVDKKLKVQGALQRESRFTHQLTNCLHIRHALVPVEERAKKGGLLLIGLQCTLCSYHRELYLKDKLKIAKDLLMGLQELQSKNIVHRDLHSANCGLSYDNRWVIHDLGYASYVLDSQKRPPNLSVAPLQNVIQWFHNRTQVVTTAYDQWSLGLILYELECRKAPPFTQPKALKNLEESYKQQDKQGLARYVKLVKTFLKNLKKQKSFLMKLSVALLAAKPLEECLALVSQQQEALLVSDDEDYQFSESETTCDLNLQGYVNEI